MTWVKTRVKNRVKTRVKTQVKFRVKTQVKTNSTQGAQRHCMVPTSAFLEHIILFTSFLKKKESKGSNANYMKVENPYSPKYRRLEAPKGALGA